MKKKTIIIARVSAAQEAASAESEAHDRFHFNGQRGKRGCVNKQRGSRVLINDPRGTRGHGNNTGGTKKKILANDQRGTISRSRVCNIRAFGSSSMIGEAVPQEAASAICTEAQESSPIITEAPEAAPAISRRKSPHQSSARRKRLRQQYRGARVLTSDPEQQIACTRGSIGHIEAQESS